MPRSRGVSVSTKAGRVYSNAEYLSSKTHFTTDECKAILVMFEHMCPTGKMDRGGVREFMAGCFDITSDVMLDFLYHAFDRNGGGIDVSEFLLGLSKMVRGTTDELIEFCYLCYDINGDQSIAREELQHSFRNCIIPGYGIDIEDIEDAEKDIIDICMKKLDYNGDGVITKDDFREAVLHDPLLLQAIGPCLPNPSSMVAFLATITEDFRSHSPMWSYPIMNSKNSSIPATMKSLAIDHTERLQLKHIEGRRQSKLGKYLPQEIQD